MSPPPPCCSGHDAKRLHYFHAMHHASEGYLAATNELMSDLQGSAMKGSLVFTLSP